MSVPGRATQKSTWVVVPPKTIPRVSSPGPSVWRLSSGCIEMKWARCVWGSIPPGTTSFPVASSTRPASTRGSGRPTATMRSPWTATSHRPTPCGVTTSPPRITRSSMVLPPSLHLGRGLPSDEPRVDLLEELRVEDTLGGDLLGDPVERVEEVDELAHAAVDLVGHLHRVDVEGHDVAREPFVHLHLTRHDLHGRLAVGVDRGRRLRERAQHRLQGVRVLLEHLAARDDSRVHEEPVDLTLLARDVAPVPGEVDLSPRTLDGVEHPRRPARHRVDVPLGERGDPVGRREVHELDLGEVHAGIQFVNLAPPDGVTALAKGDIDAMAGWAPWVFNAVKSAGGKVYFTGNRSYIPGKEGQVDWLLVHAGVVASGKMLKENPNTLKAVLRALAKATTTINTDREATVKIVAREMKMDEGLARDIMALNVYSMEMTDKIYRGMGEFVDFLYSLNRIPAKVAPDSLFYTRLLKEVDPTLVRWESKTEVK